MVNLDNVRVTKDLSWYKKVIVPKIVQNKAMYKRVEELTGVPMGFLAALHVRESASDLGVFKHYLGNGQPLNQVTTIVPKGRGPFSSWVVGAIDALKLRGLDDIDEWSIETAIKEWEAYNGYGYKNRGINTPYVWNYTNMYEKGHFYADGKFDPERTDGNIGCYPMYLLLIAADSDFEIKTKETVVPKEGDKSWWQVLIQAIVDFFKVLGKGEATVPGEYQWREVSRIPKHGDKGPHVEAIQKALLERGFKLTVDGDFGPKTQEQVSLFQKSKGSAGSGIPGPKTMEWLKLKIVRPDGSPAPWFWHLKKYEGRHESEEAFGKEMSSKWSIVGLNLKGITANWQAWCGLFLAVGLMAVGIEWQRDGATAKNWDKFGQKIEWRVNGFPQGAFIRINHKSDCNSASNNHVTLANGWCTAEELRRSGAMFAGYGGNQGNKAKVTIFPVNDICSVRWPDGQPLPGKVTESKGCMSGTTYDPDESTR